MRALQLALFLGLFLSTIVGIQAQKKSTIDQTDLQHYESMLAPLADTMILHEDPMVREQACYTFIRTFVRALKSPYSYTYPFDSLKLISILYAPDNSFRIFTWELHRIDHTYRYYGCIQMNSPELKIFPLFDNSDFLLNPEDTVLTHETWYGTFYYNVIMKKRGKRKYYILFGFDRNNFLSNKKVLDVLYFKDGKPHFGAPLFVYPEEKKTKHRLILEYKKDAAVTLNYSPQLKKIIFDHLIPLKAVSAEFKHTYVPDGSYCGFSYKRGKWYFVNEIWDVKLEDGQAPIPVPGKPRPQYYRRE